MTDSNPHVFGVSHQHPGSGLLLRGDAMYDWLSPPPPDTFTAVPPLLRRTFRTFAV